MVPRDCGHAGCCCTTLVSGTLALLILTDCIAPIRQLSHGRLAHTRALHRGRVRHARLLDSGEQLAQLPDGAGRHGLTNDNVIPRCDFLFFIRDGLTFYNVVPRYDFSKWRRLVRFWAALAGRGVNFGEVSASASGVGCRVCFGARLRESDRLASRALPLPNPPTTL